jgi:sugar/nucleoside kinase (ribokinase family)
MDLLIVGSIAFDTVETPKGRVDHALGGTAVFASVAASLFSPVNLVAIVGDDFGKENLEFLESRGIDLEGLKQAPGKTFRWACRYFDDMNRRETISTELNVFADFDPTLPERYRRSDYVLLANIQPSLQLKVLNQIKKPKFVACDTIELWIKTAREELEEVLGRSQLLVINDEEARLLTGEAQVPRAARRLLMKHGLEMVVVKRGEHGATLFSREGTFVVPAYPLEEVIDPTGAGDSFAGAMAGKLAEMRNLSLEAMKKAMFYGVVVSSFTVEDFSLNRLKRLSPEEIETRYAQIREMTVIN